MLIFAQNVRIKNNACLGLKKTIIKKKGMQFKFSAEFSWPFKIVIVEFCKDY